MKKLVSISILLGTVVFLTGCKQKTSESPQVAATNSLFQCVVMDLAQNALPVLCLAKPGTCPGHFDMRRSQMNQLRGCRVLLRLDFQKSLDKKLATLMQDGLRVQAIQIPGGLCEPESYLAACRQIAEALVLADLLDRQTAEKRLAEITARVNRTAAACRKKGACLKDRPVVCSNHQKAFCQWLGLNVVAAFSGADTASISQIDQAVQKGLETGAKLVIANRPEGHRVADSLAKRLDATVVMFDNFPNVNKEGRCFDHMLEANVNALLEAANK